MAWNGIGTFTEPSPPEFPAVPGELIRAEYFNTTIRALCAGFSNTLPRDGQADATANIHLGGFKVVGLAAASANGEAVRFDEFNSASGNIAAETAARIAADGVLTTAVNTKTTESVLAGTTGTTLVGHVDAVAGAELVTLFSILSEKKRVRTLRRAADPDWTLAFQRAAASGAKHIEVGDGTYNVAGATIITLAAGQYWFFDGAVVTHPTVNGIFLYAASIDNWGIDGMLRVEGSGIGAGAAAALYIAGCNRFRVSGFAAKGLAGWGIKHDDSGTGTGALRGDQGQYIAPHLHECYVGFENTVGAEYCTLVSPHISGCTTGMITAAGNTTVIGGNIVDNNEGLVILAGSNHAHGIISGVNINHNTVYNLRTVDVVNGQDIVDCHIYGSGAASGAVFLNNSKGIAIRGGHLDAWVYNYAGGLSGYNYLKDVYCPGSYGDIELLNASSARPVDLIVQGLVGAGSYKSGIALNDPGLVYAKATRAAGATQTITAGTQLIFPTVATNGNRRAALDVGTGAVTIPVGMAGEYEVQAELYFSGTSLVQGTSYVEMQVNGGSPRLILLDLYSTTTMKCNFSEKLYLAAGDIITFKATINGATTDFGGASWISSMTVNRIA